VGFEPTTPGLRAEGSSAKAATQGHQGSPAGVRDGVAIEQASPDDLPEKQEAAHGRPSPCMCCNV